MCGPLLILGFFLIMVIMLQNLWLNYSNDCWLLILIRYYSLADKLFSWIVTKELRRSICWCEYEGLLFVMSIWVFLYFSLPNYLFHLSQLGFFVKKAVHTDSYNSKLYYFTIFVFNFLIIKKIFLCYSCWRECKMGQNPCSRMTFFKSGGNPENPQK